MDAVINSLPVPVTWYVVSVCASPVNEMDDSGTSTTITTDASMQQSVTEE
jgi:hypothetical protein